MTSTSRRRENSDRRIVLETSSTLATTSRTASRPVVSFTTRVATRIFCVSSARVLDAVDRRVDRRVPAARRGRGERVAQLERVVGLVGRDPEGVGQRVRAEQVVGLGVARALLAQRLGLGDVLDLADVGDAVVEQVVHAGDVAGLGIGLQVDVDQPKRTTWGSSIFTSPATIPPRSSISLKRSSRWKRRSPVPWPRSSPAIRPPTRALRMRSRRSRRSWWRNRNTWSIPANSTT